MFEEVNDVIDQLPDIAEQPSEFIEQPADITSQSASDAHHHEQPTNSNQQTPDSSLSYMDDSELNNDAANVSDGVPHKFMSLVIVVPPQIHTTTVLALQPPPICLR